MLKQLIFAGLLSLSSLAAAEIVVVAPDGVGVSSLSEADVQQLFSGKKSQVGAVRLQPVDLPPDSPVREAFYRKVLDKNPSQMRSHWARLTFTGKASPPRTVSGPGELRALMRSPGTAWVGYLEADQVTEGMTVLYRLR